MIFRFLSGLRGLIQGLVALQSGVNRVLDLSTDIHLSQQIIGAGIVYAVRQKDIDELCLRIDPDTGAGKAGMAKGFRRCQRRRIRLFPLVIIFLRLIKAQSSPADIAAIGCK